jgi:hypothetical protein
MPTPGWVELVIAHPNGIVEIAEGTFQHGTVRLASTSVARTRTAKDVQAIEREFVVEGDVLRYSLRMAAVGQPIARHLCAELRRIA